MCLDCGCDRPEREGIRQIDLGRRLLEGNDAAAATNRARFAAAGVQAINLLSSPGSGKTALIERMAGDWADELAMAVLVGDLATDNDARRLRQAGIPAVQITTGSACHLDAAMVSRGLHELGHAGVDLKSLQLLVIENVGNLVCPAAYDLGETLRVVLVSVTEGEDKPLKYPSTFQSADLVVIGKVDLTDAVQADLPLLRRNVERVAPRAQQLLVSGRNGSGMDELRRVLTAAAEVERAAGPSPSRTITAPVTA
jgi:hydrogenase nickel incorporation protein HypB